MRNVSSAFADLINSRAVLSVVLGDLAVHYEWSPNWRAAINVVNIADNMYIMKCCPNTAYMATDAAL